MKLKVSFLGDIHRSLNAIDILMARDNPNIIFSLGDFGMVWEGDKDDEYLDYIEMMYPQTKFLVIPGNHENYDLIERYSQKTIYGAKAYQIRKNIFYIKRGEIVTLGTTNFMCISGADSIDKILRTEGYTWWPQEGITYHDIDYALRNREEKHIVKLDYVLSHTGPRAIIRKFYKTYYNEGQYGNSDYNLNGFLNAYPGTIVRWYFGHWHDTFTLTGTQRDNAKEIEFKCFGIGYFETIDIEV